jgi:hypothetical protein
MSAIASDSKIAFRSTTVKNAPERPAWSPQSLTFPVKEVIFWKSGWMMAGSRWAFGQNSSKSSWGTNEKAKPTWQAHEGRTPYVLPKAFRVADWAHRSNLNSGYNRKAVSNPLPD